MGKRMRGEICLELKELFEKFLLLSKPINLRSVLMMRARDWCRINP